MRAPLSRGSLAALSLTSLRSPSHHVPSPGRREVSAVSVLAAGGAFDPLEDARPRQSVGALARPGVFPTTDGAIAAVGNHADATVPWGRGKTGLLAALLVVVVCSLVRAPRNA